MDSQFDYPKYAEIFKVKLYTYAEQVIIELKFAEKPHKRKEDLVKNIGDAKVRNQFL